MKLLAATTLLALPLMANAACLTLRQIDNWDESGRRYRIEVTARAESGYSNTWKMAEDYCAKFKCKLSTQTARSNSRHLSGYQLTYITAVSGPFIGGTNMQCNQQSPSNHIAWADMSVAHGQIGVATMHNTHAEAASQWSSIYPGCGVDLAVA